MNGKITTSGFVSNPFLFQHIMNFILFSTKLASTKWQSLKEQADVRSPFYYTTLHNRVEQIEVFYPKFS